MASYAPEVEDILTREAKSSNLDAPPPPDRPSTSGDSAPKTPGIPWWKYLLAAIPAAAAGVSYGYRGQATPAEFNEPLRKLAAEKQQNALMRDLAPLAGKYPALKDFLPLIKYDPRLLNTFIEKTLGESRKVPLSTLPEWWRAQGYEKPVAPPEGTIIPFPPGYQPKEAGDLPPATLAPPPPPHTTTEGYEAFQRQGQRLVDPEAAQDVIAQARRHQLEREQENKRIEERERERKKALEEEAAPERLNTLKTRLLREIPPTIDRAHPAFEKLEAAKTPEEARSAYNELRQAAGDDKRLHDLDVEKQRLLLRLPKEADPAKVDALLDAKTPEEARKAYETLRASAIIPVVNPATGETYYVTHAQFLGIQNTKDKQARALEIDAEKPIVKSAAAHENAARDALRAGNMPAYRAEKAAAFRDLTAMASQHAPWADYPRHRITKEIVVQGLKGKSKQAQLAALDTMKRGMTTPQPPDNHLIIGVTPDEILQIEQAVMNLPGK